MTGLTAMTPPIVAAIVIALGFPVLAIIALVLFTPGVSPDILAKGIGGTVVLAFVVAAIFEIKRLADQPSDRH
jgi:hypothetical protein